MPALLNTAAVPANVPAPAAAPTESGAFAVGRIVDVAAAAVPPSGADREAVCGPRAACASGAVSDGVAAALEPWASPVWAGACSRERM